MNVIKEKPKTVLSSNGYCGGCGHGIVQRLIAEAAEELGLSDRTVNIGDIACGYWSCDNLDFDAIGGPHGRCAAVATAYKKVRPEDNVFIHAGDGASYGIGLAETMMAAMRDVPITMIVVNNTNFGMTGGQLSLMTTLMGQVTTTSTKGRVKGNFGEPQDMMAILGQMNIEFAARGALYDVAHVRAARELIKTGMERQRDNKGFSVIEILSPCPTNWGLTPVEANERIKNEIEPLFPVKVYTDRTNGISCRVDSHADFAAK